MNLPEFQKNGFIKIENFFTDEEVQLLLEEVSKIESDRADLGYYEENVLNKREEVLIRIEQITDLSDKIKKILNKKEVNETLSSMFEGPYTLFKDKVNFKYPGCREDTLHQDQQAGWTEYSDYFVTMCVALDTNTAKNSPLQFPNKDSYSHKKVILGNDWEPLRSNEFTILPMEETYMNPGDVIFFDSFVPHGSDMNSSNLSRRNLFITYASSEFDHLREEYYKSKLSSYPPNAYREENRRYEYKV